MTITRTLLFLFFSLLLSGCAADVYYVRPAPPPLEVEIRPVSPYQFGVWVPGNWYWHRGHRKYEWHEGYWRREPRRIWHP